MTTTALYCRVSSQAQADRNGTDAQRHALAQWAQGRGLADTDLAWYEDLAVSGRTMKRPGFDALCLAISAGTVQTVAALSLSRLARNVRGLLEFVELCRVHSVEIVCLKESIDTKSPPGRLFLTIMASLYAFESEMGAERVRDGMAAGKANGARYGRKPKLTPEQVAQLHTMAESGYGWAGRAAKLFGVHRGTIMASYKRAKHPAP